MARLLLASDEPLGRTLNGRIASRLLLQGLFGLVNVFLHTHVRRGKPITTQLNMVQDLPGLPALSNRKKRRSAKPEEHRLSRIYTGFWMGLPLRVRPHPHAFPGHGGNQNPQKLSGMTTHAMNDWLCKSRSWASKAIQSK